jgi:hypothetical protein
MVDTTAPFPCCTRYIQRLLPPRHVSLQRNQQNNSYDSDALLQLHNQQILPTAYQHHGYDGTLPCEDSINDILVHATVLGRLAHHLLHCPSSLNAPIGGTGLVCFALKPGALPLLADLGPLLCILIRSSYLRWVCWRKLASESN